MKRKAVLFMALLLVLTTLLGACQVKTSNGAETTTSKAATEGPADTSSGAETTEGIKSGQKELVTKKGTFIFNEEGYPITENPSTFSIMCGTTMLSMDDSIHMNNVAEETNIYPEWILVPTSAVAERKSIVYASGEYPDVLGSSMVNQSDTVTYGPEGILLDVKDLLQQYATNLNDFLTPDLWAQIECYDGNIYFLPTIYANRGGTANATNNNYFSMPSKWMDELGLEVATNVDEFYENLVAIRDGDPNGNGLQDEIPLAIQALSGNPLHALPSYFCWFGRPGTYYVEDDGTVVDGRLYEEHKEGIKFLQKCYNEGLLDIELFSLDVPAFRAKGASDPVVYGYIFGYAATYYTSDDRTLEYYDIMPLLQDQDGNTSYVFENRSSSGILYQAAITSACESPELVVRWANYMWNPEVTLQTNDGPFGVRFDYNDEGELIRFEDSLHADKIPEGYDDFTAFRNGNQIQQLPRLYGPLVTEYLEKEFNYKSELTVVNIFNYRGEEYWEPHAVQEFPVVTPSGEENEQLILYNTDIEKLYDETVTAWIVGKADIDAEWDAFIEKMYTFGAQEVLDIKQVQADRYFAALGQD